MTKKTLPPEAHSPEETAQAALRSALAPKPPPKGPRPRKVPIRTCVACRQESQKRDLVRIVRTTEGQAVLDATGKLNGRGAYLCPRLECLRLAVKRRALDRALEVALPAENMAALEAQMEALSASASG